MKYCGHTLEEDLKIRVASDFFDKMLYSVEGRIDFVIRSKRDGRHVLWAEAKLAPTDVSIMLAQLVLTVGKDRTFDRMEPPYFLGVFDCQKIAFIPFDSVQDIFLMNDFNWNVAPSNHKTREFDIVRGRVEQILRSDRYEFDFTKDERDLRFFIAENIAKATEEVRRHIDINNVIRIYQRWLEELKPLIGFNWSDGKKHKPNILDRDFYLADLFVDDRGTVETEDDVSSKSELLVVFKRDHYEIAKEDLEQRMFDATIPIADLDRYRLFWKKFKRPPVKKFWREILERQDRLVPQDVRERKGAFFTPKKWVDLSQDYIEAVLGEDWQNEYHVWDCCAGTGNLLAGLWNRDNIWASTLDQSDVNVMRDQIREGMNLWDSQVFQFDFLNDDFTPVSRGGKLPDGLYDIISDPDKRRKLVVYINPPYAEDTTKTAITGTGKNKTNVAKNKIHDRYATLLKKANHELFAQFLMRIYCEIPTCKIANFSTLKNLQSSNFQDFRANFRAKLEKIFLVPADTFDNVRGQFPIGFFVWDAAQEEVFQHITADVYDKTGSLVGQKSIDANDQTLSINKWIKKWEFKNEIAIGYIPNPAPDFQHNNQVFLQSNAGTVHVNYTPVSKSNLFETSVYFAVRQAIPADWLNDRDQFLYPDDGWKTDAEFHSDCLAYTLFSNNIQSAHGTNHWIPFTEDELGLRRRFASRFMTDFIAGKERGMHSADLFSDTAAPDKPAPLHFSPEATAVFDSGRELWRYYHAQPGANIDASLYDIREHFQGRNDKGKMNNRSTDERYNELIGDLRAALRVLAAKIEPKIYEYGFLKR